MKRTITQAIQQRRQLMLNCDGQMHTVEPHVVGQSMAGEDVVLCWLLAPAVPDSERWRLLRLCDLKAIEVLDAPIAIDAFHQPNLDLFHTAYEIL